MPKKNKLVVFLSRFPYPLDKGDKLRAFNQIKHLSTIFDVYLICTTDTQIHSDKIQVLSNICKEVHIFKLNKWIIFWKLAINIFRTKPFQVAYFYQYSIQKKTNNLLNNIAPDFIYCQLIRSSEYVKDYHYCPKTLDYMDAFSKGIERRMTSKKGWKHLLFKQEYQRLVNYERQIFEYFEHHTIISEQDRSFIAHPKQNDIKIITNGVHFFDRDYADVPKDVDLLFTGNMGYPPNLEAAKFIYHQLLPLLPKTTTCLIAGINPPSSLKKLASNSFQISGWVPDMGECYAKSNIFIAPMFIGTGLQNKLLEAMEMGLPCITTTLANKSLNALPNQQILIANSPAEFLHQIKLLQSDVRTNFSWTKSNEELIQLITN